MGYITMSASQFKDGSNRFRFIGFNCYPLVQFELAIATIDAFFAACNNYGVTVVRCWVFNSASPATNTSGNFRYLSGGVLNWREAAFVSLDKVLDSARRYGVRVVVPLADNFGGIKNDYCTWNDTINGTNYRPSGTSSVTSITRSVNTATVTTAAPHGLESQQNATIAGAAQTDYNGAYRITVTGASTFTYTVANTPTTPATGTLTVKGEERSWKFFDDTNIRQMYKDVIDKLSIRVNTINGRTYSTDDTIFSIELGNELRYEREEGYSGSNQNASDSVNVANLTGTGGWADVMSTYVKTKFPNHLCSFGDASHFWEYVSNDDTYNGSYYGVDFGYVASLANIDYLDFHLYPYAGGSTLGKFGVKYGFPSTGSGGGFVKQLDDYVARAKITAAKPIIMGEEGLVKTNVSNSFYPAYPIENHLRALYDDFFGRGGDGILHWHGATAAILDDNNYNFRLDGMHTSSNANNNLNDDPSKALSVVAQRNMQLKGKRININQIIQRTPTL